MIFSRLNFISLLFMYVFWMSLSGKYELFFLLVGLFSIFSVFIFNKLFLNVVFPSFSFLKSFLYCLWLIKEIVLSGIYVTKKILLLGNSHYTGRVLVIDDQYNNYWLTAILANSITLTPGTATIFLSNGKIYVHIIDEELISGLDLIYNKVKNSFG